MLDDILEVLWYQEYHLDRVLESKISIPLVPSWFQCREDPEILDI